MYSEEVIAEGHLVDSSLLEKIFDTIIIYKGQFKVLEFKLGTTNLEPSIARIKVIAKEKKQLDLIIGQLSLIGCSVAKTQEAILKDSEKDKTVPDDFYSTTNHRTEIFLDRNWVLVENQRMDSIIVVKDGKAVCTLLRSIKKGDNVVCGYEGVRVTPEFKERDRNGFSFMDAEVSSEKRVEISVRKTAALMKDIKKRKGKIVLVAGPVVTHSGGGRALASLIRKGYVDALLSGNALAVHDAEWSFFGTSLGVDLKTGQQVNHGHKNHMAAINQLNKYGGIKGAVESGKLKKGIFYECVKNNVPYVLAASIRDDGPVDDVTVNMIEAQKKYSEVLKGAELVIMLSSMLHSIGTGNMIPSYVKTVCVDINPAVVTKLNDRGSSQAVGIVTDVGLFLELLDKEL